MDNDIVSKLEALKSTIEERVQSSRKLDIVARFFLTDNEIEEVTKLRVKQKENMQRFVNICNYVITGKSDKLEVEFPNIDMVLIEMNASSTVASNIENQILDIYEAAANRELEK